MYCECVQPVQLPILTPRDLNPQHQVIIYYILYIIYNMYNILYIRLLNIGARWGGWTMPSSGRFTPKERSPFHIVQEPGWSGLDGYRKEKISLVHRDSNLGPFLSVESLDRVTKAVYTKRVNLHTPFPTRFLKYLCYRASLIQ